MWVKGSLLSLVVGGQSYILLVAPGMHLLAGDRVESLIDQGMIGASHVIAQEAVMYSNGLEQDNMRGCGQSECKRGNYVSCMHYSMLSL